MFKNIKEKTNSIKADLTVFDNLQKEFNKQFIDQDDANFYFPEEIYGPLQENKDILYFSENKRLTSAITNDYFQMDFLVLEIQRLFEKITSKSFRSSTLHQNHFYIKNNYRKRLQSILYSEDTFRDIRYSIQLSNLKDKLDISTENLRNVIKNHIVNNTLDDNLVTPLKDDKLYILYFNETIEIYKKIKELLEKIIDNKNLKKKEFKSLILAIFSLSIPIILFLPDYMNYKEIEDNLTYTLSYKENLIYDSLKRNTDLNEFSTILNYGYDNSNLSKDDIKILKKQEDIINTKNERKYKRTYFIKVTFTIFAIISFLLIILFF